MKRIYSSIIVSVIAGMIAMPVAGQSVKERIPGYNNRVRMDAVTGRRFKSPDLENHQRIDYREKSLTRRKLANDKQQLRDSIISERYVDSISQWVIYGKAEYAAYDLNDNNTLYLDFTKNMLTSKWDSSLKAEYIFNAGNQITNFTFHNWDTITDKWIPSEMDEVTFDINGNPTLEIYNRWDPGSGKWVALEKYEYTFDDNLYNTLTIIYLWNKTAGVWIPYSRDEMAYDDSGNNITNLSYFWDESTSQWIVNHKLENTFDDNGNNTKIDYYNWDVISEWSISAKEEFAYDSEGNNTLEITSYFDDVDSTWVAMNKNVYAYDANNNQTLSIYSNWSESSGLWLNGSKNEYTYDENNNEIQDINYNWNDTANQWNSRYKLTYYYSDQAITPVGTISENEIHVYPNPAKEFIVFDMPNISGTISIKIFDTQGKKVLEQRLPDDKQIRINNLAKGLYIWQIIYNRKTWNGKIQIE